MFGNLLICQTIFNFQLNPKVTPFYYIFSRAVLHGTDIILTQ